MKSNLTLYIIRLSEWNKLMKILIFKQNKSLKLIQTVIEDIEKGESEEGEKNSWIIFLLDFYISRRQIIFKL